MPPGAHAGDVVQRHLYIYIFSYIIFFSNTTSVNQIRLRVK